MTAASWEVAVFYCGNVSEGLIRQVESASGQKRVFSVQELKLSAREE